MSTIIQAVSIIGIRYDRDWFKDLSQKTRERACDCTKIDLNLRFCGKCGEEVYTKDHDETVYQIITRLSSEYDLDLFDYYEEGIVYVGTPLTITKESQCRAIVIPGNFEKWAVNSWNEIVRMERVEGFSGHTTREGYGLFGLWTVLSIKD